MSTKRADHEAVMSGHGFYNKHSIVQAAAAEFGIDALRAAAAAAPIPTPPQPLMVVDYGCSQGQNSLRPIGQAVAALRARTDLPVTVVHTDLPGNDFSAVFEAIARDPSSYVIADGNSYALAAGRSFYEEVVPPGTVSLGWSATTTHWLSTVPCPVPGHFAANHTDDPAVRATFVGQADTDWRNFLSARAAELAPGGRLVMVEPCAHPDGPTGSENIMGLMDEALAELVGEGQIAVETAAAATLPMWMRTPDEYASHVGQDNDLELIGNQVVEGLKSPLWAQFEADGDVAAYVGASVDAMRGWSEMMLADAITDPIALESFYDRCRRLGSVDPERLHLQVFHVVLDLGRR